jgi:Domain of unknown function (DUF932)/Protein-tyrosine phosphatase
LKVPATVTLQAVYAVDRGKPSGVFYYRDGIGFNRPKYSEEGKMNTDTFRKRHVNGFDEISFPEVIEQPVAWGKTRFKAAPGFKAIVDLKTDKVFSIVSKDYKLIRHEDAIHQVESALGKIPELGRFEIANEFYNSGGRMRRKYRLYDVSVEIAKGDYVNPEIHLYNSYDRSWPFFVTVGAFRLVCSNGLVIGQRYLQIRKRHVYNFRKLELEKQVAGALRKFNAETTIWKKWKNHNLTESTYNQIMTVMKLGKKAKKEVHDRLVHDSDGYGKDSFLITTLWVLYNVLTWFISHRAVSLNHKIDLEIRLRSAMDSFR